MADTDYQALQASNGSGEPVRAAVQAPGRSIGSTSIPVNATTNWPTGMFIATTGTLQANGTLNPTTAQVFYGTASGTTVTIISFAPGYTDKGNVINDVVVLKPTTEWANKAATLITKNATPAGVVLPYAGSAAPTGYLMCDGSSVLRATYADLFTAIGTTFGSADGTHFTLPDMRGRAPIGVGTGTRVATVASRASNVLTVTGIDNTTNNGFQTGQKVTYHTTGTVMTGLANDTDYYVIRTGNLTFSLASTLANAVAGTAISLSGDGTGVQTLTKTLGARSLGDRGGEEAHANTVDETAAHIHAASFATGAGSNFNGIAPTNNTITGSNNTVVLSTGGSNAHNNMQPFLALNHIIKT